MISLYGLLWDQQRASGGHYGSWLSTHPSNRNLQDLGSGNYSVAIPGATGVHHTAEKLERITRRLQNLTLKSKETDNTGGFTVLVTSIGVKKPFGNSDAKRQEASRERDLGMVSKGKGGVPHTLQAIFRPVTHQERIWGPLFLLFLVVPNVPSLVLLDQNISLFF